MSIFWNLLLLNLKTFAGQKFRMVVLLLLMFSVSFVAGAAGTLFLTEGVLARPIAIALVDLDDSIESRMILSAIVDEQSYVDLIEFAILSPKEAQAVLDDGYVTAIITLPEGFARGMQTGRNIPFSVTLSDERPLAAALVQVAVESFADMLRSSQIGVYTTLNFANAEGISRAEFERVLMAINMRFIGLVMNRSLAFIHDEQSATGGLYIWQAYLIAMFCTLMLCVSFALTDPMRQIYSKFTVLKLKRRGASWLKLFAACFAAIFLLFAAINTGAWFWFFDLCLGSLLSAIVLTAGFAAFASMITFVFASNFAAGSFSAVYAAISLFLSGGIIPVGFFGEELRIISSLAFNTWAVRLISDTLLDESTVMQMAACISFAFLFAAIGCFAAYCRGRVPR